MSRSGKSSPPPGRIRPKTCQQIEVDWLFIRAGRDGFRSGPVQRPMIFLHECRCNAGLYEMNPGTKLIRTRTVTVTRTNLLILLPPHDAAVLINRYAGTLLPQAGDELFLGMPRPNGSADLPRNDALSGVPGMRLETHIDALQCRK